MDTAEGSDSTGSALSHCRPCVRITCHHNLYLDISDRGSIKLNFPDREPWEVPPDKSCVLDIADQGGVTLDEIGAAMNLSHERVRQLEERGLEQLGYSQVAEEVKDAPVPLNYNEWITANEVLDRLCITWPSLQRLFEHGRILRQRDPVTNHWRYRMSDVVDEKRKRQELEAIQVEKEQRGVKG